MPEYFGINHPAFPEHFPLADAPRSWGGNISSNITGAELRGTTPSGWNKLRHSDEVTFGPGDVLRDIWQFAFCVLGRGTNTHGIMDDSYRAWPKLYVNNGKLTLNQPCVPAGWKPAPRGDLLHPFDIVVYDGGEMLMLPPSYFRTLRIDGSPSGWRHVEEALSFFYEGPTYGRIVGVFRHPLAGDTLTPALVRTEYTGPLEYLKEIFANDWAGLDIGAVVEVVDSWFAPLSDPAPTSSL